MAFDPARIVGLKVKNFRVLKDIELRDLTPLTVLLGQNGSGKSTIFDVFAFLSECLETNLHSAWDKRGGMREIRSRGTDGPVEIEIKYRETANTPLITYHLSIDDYGNGPEVAEEWLHWRRGSSGKPFRFLDVKNGDGIAITGETPDKNEKRESVGLNTKDTLAIDTLGGLKDHPRVFALRKFITGWYVSQISAENCREQQLAGPQKRLSRSGDNLGNVLQHLAAQDRGRLQEIVSSLRKRVPLIEGIATKNMQDGRLLLEIKDEPFSDPILARFASDGTLKMLAYLIVLSDPMPPPFVGMEEPENFLYPHLLYELAEEISAATDRTQVLVTTHSPYLVDAVQANETKYLSRSDDGFTKITEADKMRHVPELVENGGHLGNLWMEGHLGTDKSFPNPKARERDTERNSR